MTNSNVATPEIHYSHPQKPVYKPDLQILKRPTQSPSPQPSTPTLTKQEEESLRIEKEKKYKEARDRIFETTSSSTGEKKVWEPTAVTATGEMERGVLPIRGPKGPTADGNKGFVAGRGRGRDI